MYKTIVYLLVILFVVVQSETQYSHTEGWWNSGKAIILTADNFNQYIDTNKYMLVNFFSLYSDESKAIAPEWDILAEKYTQDGLIIGSIDGWMYEGISEDYGVDVFPEIVLLLEEGTIVEYYNGDKTAQDIIQWVESLVDFGAQNSKITSKNGNLDTSSQLDFPLKNLYDEATDDIATTYESQPLNRYQGEDYVDDDFLGGMDQASIESEVVIEVSDENLKVVIDTTVFEVQFQEVQDYAKKIKSSIASAITDNSQIIEELREILESQTVEVDDIYNYLRDYDQIIEEIEEEMSSEEKPSGLVINHRMLVETIDTIRSEMEVRPMSSKKNAPVSNSAIFLVGLLGGAVITFAGASRSTKSDKKKKKPHYD